MRILVLALLLLPAAAAAEDRRVSFGSFERLRVQGPYEVTVAAGSPGGTLSGERDAVEGVEVRLDGTTLVVRPTIERWQERGRTGSGVVRVALSTPTLSSVSVFGASGVRVERIRGERVDLSVSGTGSIRVDAADTPRVAATVIGSGTIALAGKAASARLLANGTGSIDAGDLDAGELFVRLDGSGEVRARARTTAQVNNLGLGQVRVVGGARCQVTAAAGGPVTCGADASR